MNPKILPFLSEMLQNDQNKLKFGLKNYKMSFQFI